MARYKTEVYVPIHKDDHTFEERERSIWDDMHERMERRRREWESEVDRMRHDFFQLKPAENRRGSVENLLESGNLENIFRDDPRVQGRKRFQVSFDVSQFTPEEISVRTEDQRLMVHAKHEEKSAGKNVVREFSREVDIPSHVDINQLRSTLSNDGILSVEAPVPAPAYNQIQQSARACREYQSGPVVTERDGSQKLKMVVEVGKEFRPEEVMVKTVDKKLIVNAKHEEAMAGRTSVREFSREFDLPDNVDPNTVMASMSDDGHLLIEAPLGGYTQGSYHGVPGSTTIPTIGIGVRRF